MTGVERDGGAVPPTAGLPRDPTAVIARTTIRLTGGVEVSVGDNPAAGWIAVLGQRAAPFGASAPDIRAVKVTRYTEWPRLTLPDDGTVDLEGNVKEALPGRVAVFVAGGQRQSGTISSSVDAHRIGFNLSMSVTRITLTGVNSTLDAAQGGFHDRVRTLTVHIERHISHKPIPWGLLAVFIPLITHAYTTRTIHTRTTKIPLLRDPSSAITRKTTRQEARRTNFHGWIVL